MKSRALLIASLLLLPRLARADGDVKACVDAHEKGQLLRGQGHWLEAREQFLSCARDVCPAPVKEECGPWLRELESRLPSVLIAVRGDDGSDLVDVEMSIDGKLVTRKLGATAIDLDPGEHTFHFAHAGSADVDQKILLREGERDRRIEIRLQKAPVVSQPAPPRHEVAPPPRIAQHRSKTLPFVLAGVAVTSFAAFGGFAIAGRVLEGKASDECAPNCTTANNGAYKTMYVSYYTADAFLAVGVITAVAATVLFVTSPSDPPRAATTFPTITF